MQKNDVSTPTVNIHELSRAVMRRQAALSLRVAACFVVILLGLPLVNQFLPQVAQINVGGFSLTWLILAILFYPFTWLLSGYFIRESNTIEKQIADDYRATQSETNP